MPATPLRLTPLAATLILLLSSPAQAQVQSPDGEGAERKPKTIGKVEVVAEQEGYDAALTRSARVERNMATRAPAAAASASASATVVSCAAATPEAARPRMVRPCARNGSAMIVSPTLD